MQPSSTIHCMLVESGNHIKGKHSSHSAMTMLSKVQLPKCCKGGGAYAYYNTFRTAIQ